MTERLDRIEATLERTAQQQERNASDIDTLLGAASTYELEARKLHEDVAALIKNVTTLTERSRYNEQLFETVRAEAKADREETRQLWNDAVNQMERDRAEAKSEREENAKRFETQLADSRQRFDAQQEVIQRLLVELVEMNRDNRRLRDRVDRLEAS